MTAPEALRLAFVANPDSVHVQRWANFFADRGHVVSVLDGFGAPSSEGMDARIQVIRYTHSSTRRWPLASLLHTRQTMRRLVHDLRPDVLHAHSARRYAWHAALAGFHPYVVSAWGSDVLLPQHSWRGRLWTWYAMRNADLVTAVSPFMITASIRVGARRERTVEIQHGVDVDRYRPAPVSGESLDMLGIGSVPFIFSPRALAPLYNHETIIAAFRPFAETHLLVLGGRNADAAYRQRIIALAAESGIADRVRIIETPTEDELVSLYRAATVVVSAALSDSFPLTLLEAMACATPIVAGDLPPIRSVLEHLEPALLVPPRDPDAMESAIRRAVNLDDDARRRLGEALRRHVVETADISTHMLRVEGHYRRLAQRS